MEILQVTLLSLLHRQSGGYQVHVQLQRIVCSSFWQNNQTSTHSQNQNEVSLLRKVDGQSHYGLQTGTNFTLCLVLVGRFLSTDAQTLFSLWPSWICLWGSRFISGCCDTRRLWAHTTWLTSTPVWPSPSSIWRTSFGRRSGWSRTDLRWLDQPSSLHGVTSGAA